MKKKPKVPKHPTASKRTPSSRASTSSTDSTSKWIRIDKAIPLPAYVRDAILKLDDAGYVAYVVGGSVRDFFLGRESKDHDIATSASPDELCRLFPNAVTVGKQFGVIKVPIEGSEQLLEIATFREDLDYKDYRHPKKVRFSGPEEDAKRRDFTVNALFYDPKTNRVLDVTGGMEDLRRRTIRAIGNPLHRFKEDALRLLRAVRFTANLGFELDPETYSAIQSRAKLITHVSAERVRDELTLMWTGPRPALSIELLSKLGLLKLIVPELEALKSIKPMDVWKHTVKMLQSLAKYAPVRSPALAWGTVLHDVGKPVASQRSGNKNFNGHEIDGSRMASAIATRLKMSREDSERISTMIGDHLKFKEVFQMRESTLIRFLSQPYFEEMLESHRADALAADGNLAYYEFCASRLEALKKTKATEVPKLLDGNDLIQLGLRPGPGFTEILRTVEDLALERKLGSKEEALEYVVKHFVR